jgi:4-hydroxybenzoate polyprenyltransferase
MGYSVPDTIPRKAEPMNGALHIAGAPGPDASVDRAVPLAVDLDGTLAGTNLLLESLFVLAKAKPLLLLLLPIWLAQGLARLKRRLADRFRPDIETLPYDREFVTYLQAQKQAGRTLILVTGEDEGLAHAVAAKLGLFDRVIASDGVTNLNARAKRDRLLAEFGDKGFDYAGHDRHDRVVWAVARRAVLVRSSARLSDAQSKISIIDRLFPGHEPEARVYAQALRLHHWIKNALVFVPLMFFHRLFDIAALAHAALAFLAFCLCASSIYLLNDLTDLPEDRRHPHKRHRMLASGQLTVGRAVALMPLLLSGAFIISLTQPPLFLGILAFYCVLMVAYCLRLRAIAMIDALAVAAGYTLRVAGGSAAVGLEISTWMVVSVTLFFFGLTLLKRFAELMTMQKLPDAVARARGYPVKDSSRIALFGCSSNYLALLIFAFHVRTELLTAPWHEAVWFVWVLLSYWVAHMWLMAGQGRIVADPVAFTLRDRGSQLVGVLFAIAVLVTA